MLREIPSYAIALARDGVISARAQGQIEPLQVLSKGARLRAQGEVQAAQEQAHLMRLQAWQEGYCDGFAAVMNALVPALAGQLREEEQLRERLMRQVNAHISQVLADGGVHLELAVNCIQSASDTEDKAWMVHLPEELSHLAVTLQERVQNTVQVRPGQLPYPVLSCGDRVLEVDPAAALKEQTQNQLQQWLTPARVQGWVDAFVTRVQQQLDRQSGLHALDHPEQRSTSNPASDEDHDDP